MGVVIPQVVTSDRASGAQVIDGSLKFDGAVRTHLTRTVPNITTFTLSFWYKTNLVNRDEFFDTASSTGFYFYRDGQIKINDNSSNLFTSNGYYRDSNSFYHVVLNSDGSDVNLYVNGVLDKSTSVSTQLYSGTAMISSSHATDTSDYYLSQYYFIDGQALGPESFGFTDGLTNTWKPKKYEGTFGTNGFWLPMDGNSPIGQDQSGQGNDWTQVNLSGSVALDNPQVSGAKPILNTTQGGSQAGVGVFGSRQNVGYAVTVYNDGGGNKYYIDGVKTASITGLIRGATYTFDTSDSTVSSHPFRLSATSNGSHGGGSEYTNGVAAITGAATTITIPHDAPETLYYYCTVHSGMGNDSSISGITTNEKLADQYASHCVLAVPFISGVSDDVSPSIACTSTRKSLTKQGDPTSSTSYNFYSSSTDFDGTGDYYTSGSESDFAFGTGDFTVEFWFDSDDLAGNQYGFLQISDTSGGLKTGYANGFAIYESATAGGVLLSGLTGTIPAVFKPGVWNHVALVREGTSVRLYANGVLKDTQTSSKNISGTYLALGGYYSTSYVYNGRMQDFRIYKGVAKYTSDFVVPSTSPDILPETPSGVSGGSKLTISPDTSTEGAVVFDGDSDYLSSTGPGTLAASSNWCMECTFYCTGTSSGTYRIMGANESSESSEYLQMRIRLGQYQFYTENANTLTGTAAFNKWTHMALTKSGTTVRAFVDGKQLWSTTDNNADDITTLITGWGYGSEYFPGFISNARFVNGSSVYTSEFNPPVVPLTNITNTTHLFCQSNTSATAAAVGTITANGTAAASRFTPFNTDINTVRGQETGYATLNPLHRNPNGNTISNGNLTQSTSAGNGHYRANFAIDASSGKFYFEYQPTGGAVSGMVGLCEQTHVEGNNLNGATAYSYYGVTGYKQGSPSAVDSAYGATYTFGDIIGVAFDSDNDTLEFFKNGVSQGVAFTSFPNYPYYPAFSAGSSTNTVTYKVNFGQKPFKFPPPDGFQPLNTANTRPVKVISRPDQYVGIVTYTGTGNPLVVRDLNMKPDLIWIKNRGAAQKHTIVDSVRTTATGEYLSSSDNAAQGTGVHISGVENGISIADPNSSTIWYNDSSYDYVSWSWKAGGNKNTFNIDHVGYSTAGDVNMSVGDLNGTAFNTSAIWSDMMSGPSNSGVYTNLFDGTDGPSGGYEQATDGNTLTFTPTGGITASTSIEIYVHQSSSTYSGSADITVNGTSIKTSAVNSTLGTGSASGYVNIGTKSLTTLTWSNPSGSNNDYRLMAIRVDGKILLDSDQTAPNVPTINATGCSVGTKQGFSIIKYTGTGTAGSIAHGLSEQPKFVIIKDLKNANAWAIQHVGTTLGRGLLKLGASGNAAADNSVATAVWNSTSPSSYVFNVGTSGDVNYTTNSAEYIAYLWHDVPGLQKFGSFTGNANADGPYVEIGFKPAVVWIKNSADGGSSDNWACFDNVREGYNVDNDPLYLNKVNTEATTDMIDLLSDGFKIRGTFGSVNGSGDKMVYCAWAAAPSVDLFGGGANAR